MLRYHFTLKPSSTAILAALTAITCCSPMCGPMGSLMSSSIAQAQMMPAKVTYAEARCVDLVKADLVACGSEFEGSYVCACKANGVCEWHTRCSHSDVPEAGFDATVANRFEHGPGVAYSKAMLKVERILAQERGAELREREGRELE